LIPDFVDRVIADGVGPVPPIQTPARQFVEAARTQVVREHPQDSQIMALADKVLASSTE
jgi:hypothetical protein